MITGLDVARSQVGVFEATGQNDGILAEAHPDHFVVIEGNYANKVASVVHKRRADGLVPKFIGAARPRTRA